MSINLARICRSLSTRILGRVTQRFARDEGGSAAIEFAVVALPFFALLFAIMQTALVFFAGQILETANGDAARLVRTGQAQTQTFDAVAFKNNLCSRIKGMMSCDGISIDVKAYQNFSSVNPAPALDADGNLQTGSFGFNAGGPGDIVIVRAMYPFPMFVSMYGLNMSNMAGNKRLLMATAAFRNEPYQ